MAAEHARAFVTLHGFAHMGKSAVQGLKIVSHGRRQKRSHAGLGLKQLHFADGLRVIVHRIGTDAAVDVDIEKTRRDIGAFGINGLFDSFRRQGRKCFFCQDITDVLIEQQDKPLAYGEFSFCVRQDSFAVQDCFHIWCTSQSNGYQG